MFCITVLHTYCAIAHCKQYLLCLKIALSNAFRISWIVDVCLMWSFELFYTISVCALSFIIDIVQYYQMLHLHLMFDEAIRLCQSISKISIWMWKLLNEENPKGVEIRSFSAIIIDVALSCGYFSVLKCISTSPLCADCNIRTQRIQAFHSSYEL